MKTRRKIFAITLILPTLLLSSCRIDKVNNEKVKIATSLNQSVTRTPHSFSSNRHSMTNNKNPLLRTNVRNYINVKKEHNFMARLPSHIQELYVNGIGTIRRTGLTAYAGAKGHIYKDDFGVGDNQYYSSIYAMSLSSSWKYTWNMGNIAELKPGMKAKVKFQAFRTILENNEISTKDSYSEKGGVYEFTIIFRNNNGVMEYKASKHHWLNNGTDVTSDLRLRWNQKWQPWLNNRDTTPQKNFQRLFGVLVGNDHRAYIPLIYFVNGEIKIGLWRASGSKEESYSFGATEVSVGFDETLKR